jgi:phenylacetate-CoA ligase
MNLALKYLSPLIYNLRYGRVVQLSKEFAIRQWWSSEDLLRFGYQRARSLAIHSSNNVPYYRRLFNNLGIDATTMNLPEDWNRLPVLEKDTLRSQYNGLIAETEHAKRARQNHSGGSTGKPVAFLSDLVLYEIMAANMRLIFSWAGWRPGEMVLHLWGGQGPKLPLSIWNQLKVLFSGNLVLPVYSYDDHVFMRWWEVINIYKPTIIYTYPSVISDFSLWLESKGFKPEGIKGVFCSAEVLLDNHRKIIERIFNCKVYNQYGSRETPCVACECPEGNMHIFVDLNRVEFLNQTEERGPKKIIVTPLENYAQPLLRYDLGDMGFQKPGKCSCGRGYPLMDLTIGRNRDCLSTSDGRRIYPGFVTRFLDGENWVRNFQFRQRKINLIELSLEVSDRFNSKELINRLSLKLQPKLKDMMGSDVNLNINLVDSIERTAAGKHRFVINEIEENK